MMKKTSAAFALGLIAAMLMIAPFPFAHATSSTEAWGVFFGTSFYSGTAVGLQEQAVPYEVAGSWGGTDSILSFVLTAFTPCSLAYTSGNIAYQIGLVVRHGTDLMDVGVETPGQTSVTITCSECANGDRSQDLSIPRISNGWDLDLNGSSSVTITGGCVTSDKIDQSYDQPLFVIEALTTVTESQIYDNFAFGNGLSTYEQSPVGSGTWATPTDGYAFYSNPSGSCTNLGVGTNTPPSWASSTGTLVDGYVDIGTTDSFSGTSCGNTIWT